MKKDLVEQFFHKYLENYHPGVDDHKIINKLKRSQKGDVFDVSLFSKDFFNFLIYESDLNEDIKSEITLNHYSEINSKNSEIGLESLIHGINTVQEIFDKHFKDLTYNFDILFFGKTLPIYAKFLLVNPSKGNPRHISIVYSIYVCDCREQVSHSIFHKDIIEAKKEFKKITFFQLLEKYGLFQQKTNIDSYLELVNKANFIAEKSGKQYVTDKKGLIAPSRKVYNFISKNISKNGELTDVVIENNLELTDNLSDYERQERKTTSKFTTPYVRIFSLFNKSYFLIHIDDIEEYQYDKSAFSQLIISTTTKNILSKVFNTESADYYGDFIKNKHGGLVILAEGPPGVGKTSTAEVYAELQEKPLYIVQIDELGYFSNIEQSLIRIFDRVEKWKAVLLFDEIDIFLYKRQDNLNQSAIVGIFLRLLDYFSGLIFFTTNRIDVLDPAILSRVSLKITYPSLDEKSQKQIWESKLTDANVTIDSLNLLPKMELNGRKIKNAIRLSKIIYGNDFEEDKIKILIENYL